MPPSVDVRSDPPRVYGVVSIQEMLHVERRTCGNSFNDTGKKIND